MGPSRHLKADVKVQRDDTPEGWCEYCDVRDLFKIPPESTHDLRVWMCDTNMGVAVADCDGVLSASHLEADVKVQQDDTPEGGCMYCDILDLFILKEPPESTIYPRV